MVVEDRISAIGRVRGLRRARALQAGTYAGAAFIGAFFAFYLWHSTNFLRRNRPGRYDAHALPKDVMPAP